LQSEKSQNTDQFLEYKINIGKFPDLKINQRNFNSQSYFLACPIRPPSSQFDTLATPYRSTLALWKQLTTPSVRRNAKSRARVGSGIKLLFIS
jgi:hypothetical protein